MNDIYLSFMLQRDEAKIFTVSAAVFEFVQNCHIRFFKRPGAKVNDGRRIFYTCVLCCFAYSDLHVHLSPRQLPYIETTSCVPLNIVPKMFKVEVVELSEVYCFLC
jgi:hypothetical protein